MNVRMDARIVPDARAGARVDYGHVVVLDDFFDEPIRAGLLDMLTEAGWDDAQGPPTHKWERQTADGAGLPRTWGLRDEVLQQLADSSSWAMKEVHSRLCKLYPDVDIAHMPSEHIQADSSSRDTQSEHSHPDTDSAQRLPGHNASKLSQRDPPAEHSQSAMGASDTLQHCPSEALAHAESDAGAPGHPASDAGAPGHVEIAGVHCDKFVGNAAVHGDDYTWHIDADPAALPPSPWTKLYGDYCNGQPGVHPSSQ